MKNYLNKLSGLILIATLSATSCSVQKPTNKIKTPKESKISHQNLEVPKKELDSNENLKVDLPKVKREFRGVWIATVANINWPSSKNLSTQEQKNEVIEMLDMLQDLNFNAVIFQARPSADALYNSEIEPWSYFLTGETGKKPFPFYDPLSFWIEEAHKRNMELHVWLNPYRAHHSNGGKVSSEALAKKMPNEIVRLKNGMYWFDPGNKETQNHVSNVVKDIVKRYDVDGIHFDDYFYPYASYNGGNDFPDSTSWNTYKNAGGDLNKADWRRNNVNTIIERIYKEIKSEKKYVKFGISPFGIWKSGYPNGVSGMSQYDELYADAKLWLNKGWVDYFTPQLYWPIDAPRQSFTKLLNWWNDENTHQRHLWPGLNTVEVKANDKASEIVKQLSVTEDILEKNIGAVHYSVAGITQNFKLRQMLKNGPYKDPALIPATTWMESEKILKPSLNIIQNNTNVEASFQFKGTKEPNQWILYVKYDDSWEIEILNKEKKSKLVPKYKNGKSLKTIALRAVDRFGNESDYDVKKIQ